MKTINNAVITDAELMDLRSEGQILADEDADEMYGIYIDELKAELKALDWIFDCYMTVDVRYINRYEQLINELPESERAAYADKYDWYFGKYGELWEYELGWDA